MKVRTLIHVTDSHIERGQMGNMWTCPVALALNEVTGALMALDAHVYKLLPASARRFIRNFDAGKRVKPFGFYFKVSI